MICAARHGQRTTDALRQTLNSGQARCRSTAAARAVGQLPEDLGARNPLRRGPNAGHVARRNQVLLKVIEHGHLLEVLAHHPLQVGGVRHLAVEASVLLLPIFYFLFFVFIFLCLFIFYCFALLLPKLYHRLSPFRQ